MNMYNEKASGKFKFKNDPTALFKSAPKSTSFSSTYYAA